MLIFTWQMQKKKRISFEPFTFITYLCEYCFKSLLPWIGEMEYVFEAKLREFEDH